MHKKGYIVLSNFYSNFVRLCAANHMSESGAAKKIGLSNAAANGWKNGKIPSNTTRAKLASLFNVDVSELMGDCRETDIKKEATGIGDLSDTELELIELFRKLPAETQEAFPALLEATLKARGLL